MSQTLAPVSGRLPRRVIASGFLGSGLRAYAFALYGLVVVLLRCVQGVAVGGEWGGAALLCLEHTVPGRRGLATSLPQCGVVAGNMSAAGALWLAAETMSDAAFQDWGWRIPFLASSLILVL